MLPDVHAGSDALTIQVGDAEVPDGAYTWSRFECIHTIGPGSCDLELDIFRDVGGPTHRAIHDIQFEDRNLLSRSVKGFYKVDLRSDLQTQIRKYNVVYIESTDGYYESLFVTVPSAIWAPLACV